MSRAIEKYNKGEKFLGSWLHTKSPVTLELMYYGGFDSVVLDMEHAPVSDTELAGFINAARACGISSFTRAASGSRENILHALDMGTDAVIVPDIHSAAEVEKLVEYSKFAPVGKRGYCMVCANGWSRAENHANGLESYFEWANANTKIIPQCETADALNCIEEIAAVKGLDGILIGPYDLSIDMGMPGQFDNPVFKAAIARILKACKDNKLMSIIVAGNPEGARAYLDMGFDGVMYSTDTALLYGAIADAVKQINL